MRTTKEYNQEFIDKLHRAQLENLRFFADLCEKNNLNWFLCYGSLIGAVRHGGFIPWDDDFDVAMLRPDYDKFIEIAHKEQSDDFEVLCVKYEKTYQRPFARVQLKGTTYIEPSMEGADTKEGIYIDVFVLDRVPADEEKAASFMKKTAFWQIVFGAMMIEKPQILESGDEIEAKKRKQWKFIHEFGRITHFPKRMLFTIFEKKATKYKDTYTGKVACIKGSSTAIQEENWCINTIPWYFEGIKVRIPAEFDSMLHHIYGNYRKIKKYNHNPVFMDFGDWENRLSDGWRKDEFGFDTTDYDRLLVDSAISKENTILFHFTSLGFLHDSKLMISSMKNALKSASGQNVRMVFAPSVSLEFELNDLMPEVYSEYKALVSNIKDENIYIIPLDGLRRREMADRVEECCDAFYGDYTTVVDAFVASNKPVMIKKYDTK